MITSKYITLITVAIVIIAVLFAGAAMYSIDYDSDTVNSAAIRKEYVSKIFETGDILSINIDIKQEDWDWLIENALEEEYRPCNITINGETFYNVAIRPKGNSSLTQVYRDENTDRYSFKINFGKYTKKQKQTLYGLSKLVLNNVISDATYMKEYLSYNLMSAMGIPSPACAYANISINGEPWGLYLAVETIDKSFLQRYYGLGGYNLYKPEPMDMAAGGEFSRMQEAQQKYSKDGGNIPDIFREQAYAGFHMGMPGERDAVEGQDRVDRLDGRPGIGGQQERVGGMGGMNAKGGANLKYIDDNPESYSVIKDGAVLKTTGQNHFKKVIDMIKALDSGEDLEKYLDVDEIIRYFAVNTFLVNLDSYSGGMYHNYYLFEENGVFQILPWDFNLSFAGFGMQDAQKAVNFPIDSPTTDSLENAPLIGKLLEVPEYKELYHKYLQEILKIYTDNGGFEQIAADLHALIGDYVKNDVTAFYTYEQYENSLSVLVQFVKDRMASIEAQLSGEQPSDSYGNIKTTVNLQALGGMGAAGGEPGKNDWQRHQMGGQMPQMNPDENWQGGPAEGNMPGGNWLEDSAGNMPTGRDIPAGGPQENISRQMPVLGSSNSANYLVVAICIVLLAGGILFAYKFKRKKSSI